MSKTMMNHLYDDNERLVKTNRSYFFIILLLTACICILMFVVFRSIGSEGVACTTDPLVYGAAQLKELNGKELQCQCTLFSQGKTPTLYFNDMSKWLEEIEPTTIEYTIPKINFSTLN